MSMLGFASRNRSRPVAIAAILLLVGGIVARYFTLHRPLKVGEFFVAAPTGWSQLVLPNRKNDASMLVIYKKDNLWISLSWSAVQNPPKTLQDLKNDQKKHKEDLADQPRNSRMSVEPLVDTLTRLNGMPARFVKDTARTPNTLHRQFYTVVHGNNLYELFGIITNPPKSSLPSQQQADFEQGWKQITDAMKL